MNNDNKNNLLTVSVVIPTYNRSGFLKGAVESVLSQEGQGSLFEICELIIADDCSGDDTENVVAGISECCSKVKYYKTEKNGGPSAARNLGAKKASGDWIALLDSDDRWTKDKLQKQLTYAVNNPQFDLIYCGMKIDSYEKSYCVPNAEEDRIYLEGNIILPLLIKNFIGAPSMLVKRSVWNEVGGFNEDFRFIEDWEFALRIASNHQIGFVDELLVLVEELSDGVSSDWAGWFVNRAKIIGQYKDILLQYDLFNDVVGKYLEKAEKRGILEQSSKLLEKCLI